MRLTILTVAFLALHAVAATAEVPNMTCKAQGTAVGGPPPFDHYAAAATATDIWRVASGRLYHRWSGREEYFYNDIKEIEVGRYTSGNKMLVLDHDNRSGYVVIAGPLDWRVVYIDCTANAAAMTR